MQEYRFDTIPVGASASFTRRLDAATVDTFAELSGDHNPLHMDGQYAASTTFGKRVVHGLLLGSLFSALVGEHLPGKHAVLLAVDARFRKPAFVDDVVTVQGVVEHKHPATKTLTVKASITSHAGEVLVTALITVQVLQ